MATPKWKPGVKKKLDKALKDKKLSKKQYDKFIKALKAAKDITAFVKAINSGKGGLGSLGKKTGLKWAAAGALIDILIVLVQAGPCPWTGIIVARINKLIVQAELDDASKATKKKLQKLKRKYTTAFNKCQRQANGIQSPQDINKAFASAIASVPGVNIKVARAIISESESDPFHSPWEALRVPGVTMNTIHNLLEGGFYFGISGAAMFAPDEIAPDMSRAAKIHVEFGFSAGPLVDESFAIHHCLEEEEAGSSRADAGSTLVARLIDKNGRTFGYRTKNDAALSLNTLVAEVEAGKRNLEVFTLRGRQYVRRPANDIDADNLSKLPVERYAG